MTHMLMLDTCVWLDMAVDVYGDEILSSLQNLLGSGLFGLVIPAVVIEEFRRHKAGHAKQLSTRIAKRVIETRRFVKEFATVVEKQALLDGLDRFSSQITKDEAAATKRLDRIDWIFDNSANIIAPSIEIKEKALQRGIEKKAPFHLNKNSAADAVILETLLAAKGQLVAGGKAEFTFVTSNKDDFSDPKDNRKPHPDFIPLFDGISYSINIADTLNDLGKLLPAKPQPLAAEVVRHVDRSLGIGKNLDNCPECKAGRMISIGAHPSRYGGWSIWEMCEKCGFKWDTGDPYDD